MQSLEDCQCRVCFDVYNETYKRPKFLLCGHTFCLECLNNMLSDHCIKCPACRKLTTCLSAF